MLTHVLAAIASTPDAHRMIFKGGTALRLCSFEDYRSSADLDFSLVDGMTADEGGTQSPRRSTTLCHSTHLPNPSAPFRTMYAAAQTWTVSGD